MNIESFRNSILLSDFIERKNREKLSCALGFGREFGEKYRDEISKLPFHLNIIDELHADENAHSRIFAQLLRYRENSKHSILESFLTEVCGFKLVIEKPEVMKVDSCGRIDIPIFDKNYVVVIENKVTDKAPDQINNNGGQLARYIETVKNNYNRTLEEIYIVYTPKYTREPPFETWMNSENQSYKEAFKSRFCSISYRDVIYPWLKDEILPKINVDNIFLRSALEQYVDYLEGLFSIRTINKPMNMKLQEFIKSELGISDENPENAIEILAEKETELNNAITQIQLLKSLYQKQIVEKQFSELEKRLQVEFPNHEVKRDFFIEKPNIINIGVKFKINTKEYVAILEGDHTNHPFYYYGIGRHFSSHQKHDVCEELSRILQRNELIKPEDFWYGWKSTSLENGYVNLMNLTKDILSTII